LNGLYSSTFNAGGRSSVARLNVRTWQRCITHWVQPQACHLLGTTEQVAVQCSTLDGAATVDRRSRETNVLHVRWRNVLRSTVRKIRVGIEDGVLHTLEALAERSALIGQHVLGELDEVYVRSFMVYVQHHSEACAPEVLVQARW